MATILIACFTLLDIRNAECRTACIWAGFDDGKYNDKLTQCECIDLKDYIAMTKEKRLRIGHRPNEAGSN